MIGWLNSEQSSCCLMPSVRASCCPLPLATPSGECVNHQSSVTLLCLNYKWGLFSMIKQICHASGGNMMECLPSGGWFSLGLRPRENHPPSGKHSIMLPPLAWHICIMLYIPQSVASNRANRGAKPHRHFKMVIYILHLSQLCQSIPGLIAIDLV